MVSTVLMQIRTPPTQQKKKNLPLNLNNYIVQSSYEALSQATKHSFFLPTKSKENLIFIYEWTDV